jgi:N-dimethylarginine dimethylaminohydrolase
MDDERPEAKRWGAQDMTARLRRVVMRRPDRAMAAADPALWHYGPGFDSARAAAQYAVFADMIGETGAEIDWIPDADDLADSIFTHDPSLVTDAGAVILNMGKPLRKAEPGLHRQVYEAAGVPVIGALEGEATVEGGDCVWLDRQTLAVGRGARSNSGGIAALGAILAPHGVEVVGYDLPYWQGAEACLHLMSVISPLADDLALVYLPLLPYPFFEALRERGIRLLAAPGDEFAATHGLSLNVLATAPGEVIAVAGAPKTRALIERAGCRVRVFEADALCLACEGGPTCLTRPVWRA